MASADCSQQKTKWMQLQEIRLSICEWWIPASKELWLYLIQTLLQTLLGQFIFYCKAFLNVLVAFPLTGLQLGMSCKYLTDSWLECEEHLRKKFPFKYSKCGRHVRDSHKYFQVLIKDKYRFSAAVDQMNAMIKKSGCSFVLVTNTCFIKYCDHILIKN